MASVQAVVDVVEGFAPPALAYPNDPIGLHIGDLGSEVSNLCVTLDVTDQALAFAIESRCEMVLAHHPLIYDPIRAVRSDDRVGRLLLLAAQQGIAIMSAHTNLDVVRPGINDTLATKLGLTDIEVFGLWGAEPSWLVTLTCPPTAAEAIIDAACKAGAGNVGKYSHCAFSVAGIGQFLPLEDSHPSIGQIGKREMLPEIHIQMRVSESARKEVESAVRLSHPYQEPEISFLRRQDVSRQGAGRMGDLKEALSPRQLGSHVAEMLGTSTQTWIGIADKPIRRVGVVGGAASSEWENAWRAGADAFVTGEVRQNHAVDAIARGLTVVQASHFHTEHPGIADFGRRVAQEMELGCEVFEPVPGQAGRPLP